MSGLVYMTVGVGDVRRLSAAAAARSQAEGPIWRVWKGRAMIAVVRGHDPADAVRQLLPGWCFGQGVTLFLEQV